MKGKDQRYPQGFRVRSYEDSADINREKAEGIIDIKGKIVSLIRAFWF